MTYTETQQKMMQDARNILNDGELFTLDRNAMYEHDVMFTKLWIKCFRIIWRRGIQTTHNRCRLFNEMQVFGNTQ